MSPIHVFSLLLVGVWIALLGVFSWLHRPEQTIADIIRSLESRS